MSGCCIRIKDVSHVRVNVGSLRAAFFCSSGKDVEGVVDSMHGSTLSLLCHGRDVHLAWVNVVTVALALKLFGGQVMRAEVMLESREGSGFWTKLTKSDLDSFW
jgi:hypothetical protein